MQSIAKQPKKIAFIILRMNFYRLLSPLINEALKQGWEVECWHEVLEIKGAYAKEIPNKSEVPSFSTGAPTVLEVKKKKELIGLLELSDSHFVVTLVAHFLGDLQQDWKRMGAFPKILLIEPTPGDWFGNIATSAHLEKIDYFGITTDYWLENNIQNLHECKSHLFGPEEEKSLRNRSRIVGWPQADQKELIDPKAIRQRWGIQEGKKVVVYLNFPVVTQVKTVSNDLFHIEGFQNRWKAAKRSGNPWRSLSTILFAPRLTTILNELRSFCDRNDAVLIGKYRLRDQPLAAEKAVLDQIITDDHLYPHPICELMSIADLSVGWLSMGVREAIIFRKPHWCFDFTNRIEDKGWGEKTISWLKRATMKRGPMNFPPIVTFIQNLSAFKSECRKSWKELEYSNESYQEYESIFLSPHLGKDSAAVLAMLEVEIIKIASSSPIN